MKYAAKRNYGYGRSLRYAIKNAIRDRYDNGSYGSQRSHCSRLNMFVKYLEGRGIKDLRKVDCSVVEDYGRMLRDLVLEAELEVTTAQNRLSSVNVLMGFLRHDKVVWVSPSRFVGRRTTLAQEAPASLDLGLVIELVSKLIEADEPRVALAVLLCRLLGARIMEASLLDLKVALRRAKRLGTVKITKGSKANLAKKIPRVIEIPGEYIEMVENLMESISEQNVILAGMTFAKWYQRAYRVMRPIAEKLGLATGFHHFRQAWACEKYTEITGCDAPCVVGCRVADRDVDMEARKFLAEALGHGRTQVVSGYVGGVR